MQQNSMTGQNITSIIEPIFSISLKFTFQIGRYVIDKKDVKNVDNFPIWKIESGILLKKFEMHIVKGKMMHKPVKVVRAFPPI